MDSSAQRCLNNEVYVDGQCVSYAFITNPRLNWSDAEQYCMSNYGGHLASVKNQEILEHVLDLYYEQRGE